MPKSLFRNGEFTSHAGLSLPYKIDCDALTDDDVSTVALALYRLLNEWVYGRAVGIPQGGMRLAAAMETYCVRGSSDVLIVDDVFTTGMSMEETYAKSVKCGRAIKGVVIFARGVVPEWITPLFTENV